MRLTGWLTTQASNASQKAGPYLLTLAVTGLILASPLFAAPEELPPHPIHALLINGGAKPESNYLSHLHHLEDMVELLEGRGITRDRIHIFSADGEGPEPDLAVRGTLPSGFWLIQGLKAGQRLRPRTELIDSEWKEVSLQPATKSALEEWFQGPGQELAPDSRLLLFVTDHGTKNREDLDNGAISLWGENLSVDELKEYLAQLPPGVRTVMVMSQCFSGTFANAMFDRESSEPSGGVCGFFSTSRDLPAYGCYPEGRDRDQIGHAFQFIEALDRQVSTEAAHLEVLVADRTPDVPLRTSDLYMARLVETEAEDRDLSVEVLSDRLLAEAWLDRAAWEPEIRLLDRIGNAFGTFSPRTLAELNAHDKELPALIEQMDVYAQRWRGALTNVKGENLNGFLEANPVWRKRLESKEEIGPEERKTILAELLPQLESHAGSRPEIRDRLEHLRNRSRQASEAGWRLEVRRAAVRRFRSILIGVAGRVLLDGRVSTDEKAEARQRQQQALEHLEMCEAFEPGALQAVNRSQTALDLEPFPPMAHELALLEEVLPSWLGVRFGQVPEGLKEGRELPPGATWLRTVYPESPAHDGGLESGDVVLGPPGHPFTAFGQISEWTMTSPRDKPLQLAVLRPGLQASDDQSFEATLSLKPYPLEWPKLPGPPQIGEVAPPLPAGLVPVGKKKLPRLADRSHILFFWATWCVPCKAAVPEVLAYAKSEGLKVLAITDEAPDLVSGFLEEREEKFFKWVAADTARRSLVTYGVSGTPTIIVVDENGSVRHMQVGYNLKKGLGIEGWSWSPPEK